mgnify:CR=1 FL=1
MRLIAIAVFSAFCSAVATAALAGEEPVQLKKAAGEDFGGKDVTIWNLLTHRGGLGMVGVTVAGEDGPDRPTHPLPPQDFVYGRACSWDVEGATEGSSVNSAACVCTKA